MIIFISNLYVMKKNFLLLSFFLGASFVSAQDLTSKKGEPILPEAEDWAISMNADPIFEFVGNAFNGNTKNNAANTNWLSASHTIIGKRFINEKSAYRFMVRLGFVNQTFKNMVTDDAQSGTVFNFPDKQGQVEDKYKHSNFNLCLGAGKEWRKGKTRLQGYYGADIMIWIGSSKDKFTYGNQMSALNNSSASGGSTTTSPTSTVWFTDPDSSNFGMADSVGARTSRAVLNKSGMTFGIGVRGFVGVEYFLFPKIAIGAEYGLGLGYQMTGKGRTEVQTQGGAPLQVANVDYEIAGSSKFGFDTDINQGKIFGFNNAGTASLKITFHF
jgi:hypothetical protein